jgi:hypothetical protein
MLCSPLRVNRCFGGTCRLHFHGRRVSQARNQHETGTKQSRLFAGFFLDLLFNTEDGGNMFLWNVGWLSPDYRALYLRRQNSSLQPLREHQILQIRTRLLNVADDPQFQLTSSQKQPIVSDWATVLRTPRTRTYTRLITVILILSHIARRNLLLIRYSIEFMHQIKKPCQVGTSVLVLQ